jgi:hypothetical protein
VEGLRNEVIDALNDYTKKATEIAMFSPLVSNRPTNHACMHGAESILRS